MPSLSAFWPERLDLRRAKKVLVYLRDTNHWSLKFIKLKLPFDMRIYVDSSCANGKERRSIFGFIVTLNDQVLHHRSCLEPLVTLSSTESEFIALSLTMKDVKWLQNLLAELHLPLSSVIVYCDNQGVVKLIRNRNTTGRCKHIGIRYQFVKQVVLKEEREVHYVATESNIADLFTKPLGRLKFHKFAKWSFKLPMIGGMKYIHLGGLGTLLCSS